VTTVSTGPFTELNARRLGPVRRFFVARPRAMDALVVVVAALLAVGGALSPGQSSKPVLSVALAVAGALALVWRRSRPVLVAAMVSLLGVVAVAATGAASGMELTLGFAVYCVAAELPTRDAWLTAGLATVFMLPAVWFWELPSPDPRAGRDGGTLTVDGEAALSDDRVGTLVGLVIVALAAMAIGTSVRGRRQHLNELLARANAFARDRDQQAELARAAERTRIAREMHDVVAQPLGDDHPGGRGSRRSGPLPGPLPRGAHRAVRDGPLGPGRHAPGAGRAPG
jgi:signal transduction histidine kinase